MDKPQLVHWLVMLFQLVTFGGFVGIAIASALMMTPLFRMGPGNWAKVWQSLPQWHRNVYLGSWAAFLGGFVVLTLLSYLGAPAQA